MSNESFPTKEQSIRSLPYWARVAIMAVRDQLIVKQLDDAYHQLYASFTPPCCYQPWRALEGIPCDCATCAGNQPPASRSNQRTQADPRYVVHPPTNDGRRKRKWFIWDTEDTEDTTIAACYSAENAARIADALNSANYPFDGAAILGTPQKRRISLQFETDERHETALRFLDMADDPE
jgi:hypothetical protein